MNPDLLVVGAGPAGMLAAGTAAEKGSRVILLERNREPGRKLLLTGQGRCNLTSNSDIRGLIANIAENGDFLRNAFHRFNVEDTIAFFNRIGLRTKIERGKRVFPVSNKADSVRKALTSFLLKNNVQIVKARIDEIRFNRSGLQAISDDGKVLSGKKVILATGGASYPETGSDGSGYELARKLGHNIVDIRPALVPLNVREKWVRDLDSLDLKNIRIRIYNPRKKIIHEDFGELSFNSTGVGGPVILTASSLLTQVRDHILSIDLKPGLNEKKLDERILRDLRNYPDQSLRKILRKLLPLKLIPVFIRISGLSPDQKGGQISRENRARIRNLLKNLELQLTGFRPLPEALITRGGVDVKEIDPITMESRIVPGLYFAGEVIDVDALTGGFNLQIAWTTGRIAGLNCC